MYNSFLQLLSATLAPTAQANFLGLLGIYTCAATPAIARAAAYQQMWRMLAPGVNNASVRILFGFGRMALAGAGVGMEVIAGAYAAMAAFMAGTGGMVILIILIALLILVLLWLAFNMYQDWMKTVQTRQRQQNDELERNTKKLFSSSWLSYSALANDQVCGPVYPIRYQKLQPGCSVG